MCYSIPGILYNKLRSKSCKKKQNDKTCHTTRWQYCLKYQAYSTETIVLWTSIAHSAHTTCLQLQCKMDIFKEGNHKLVISAGFVLIFLLRSTVEQVLFPYCGSDSSGTMLLDFNTKRVEIRMNILQSMNILQTHFFFHVLSFWRREIWGH